MIVCSPPCDVILIWGLLQGTWPALWLGLSIWSVMFEQELSLALIPGFANLHNPQMSQSQVCQRQKVSLCAWQVVRVVFTAVILHKNYTTTKIGDICTKGVIKNVLTLRSAILSCHLTDDNFISCSPAPSTETARWNMEQTFIHLFRFKLNVFVW